MDYPLSRDQAYELMKQGIRVQHKHFEPDEYLHFSQGVITTESWDNYETQFWKEGVFADNWRQLSQSQSEY